MDFKLVCLGNCAAGPVAGRWASAQYFKVGRTGFLIDCAEGTQIALQEAGIGWSSIDYILISHLHGDHCYGLPGLLTSWALHQRQSQLTIIGPAGLEAWITHTLELSYATLTFEVTWQVSHPSEAPQRLADTAHWTLDSLPLKHRIPCHGFLLREQARPRNMLAAAIKEYDIPFSEMPAIKAGADFVTASGERIPNEQLTTAASPPRAFAYCSDTAYHEALIPLVKGVDLLYHEATFLHEHLEQAIYTGHTTSRQAAELAHAAQVGQLVIGHCSRRYTDLTPLLEEARSIFPATVVAQTGRVIRVDFGFAQPT
ncbi:MAG: ribonuclease Z [Bacteroidetes bacterium]|nr:MAG: ribonuclease Z [Bacteroidota bacterium]